MRVKFQLNNWPNKSTRFNAPSLDRFLTVGLGLCLFLLTSLANPSLAYARPPQGPARGPAAEGDGPPAGGGDAGAPGGGSGSGNDASSNKTTTPQDEDFSGTPFTEYGEFNEISSEEADQKFFKFGRFFGVSLGLGFEFADGNRGALWQGGFPMVDFKVHYWFDFNFALDLGFFVANHYFDTNAQNLGHVDVNMLHLGVDLKYYFNTQNLSAPISFANPYLSIGFGSYSKTQNSATLGSSDSDTSVGVALGGGLEFALIPNKTFFEVEAKVHLVHFKDTYTTIYQAVNGGPGLQDMTGNFYTVSGNFLFTW